MLKSKRYPWWCAATKIGIVMTPASAALAYGGENNVKAANNGDNSVTAARQRGMAP